MIRPMEPGDRNRVLDIWLRASEQSHGFMGEGFWRDKLEAMGKHYLPMADNFVWEKDGQVQGFVSLVKGEYIGALFVAPEAQGQGVGKALLDHCKSRSDVLTLGVYVENRRAVRFYCREGFEVSRNLPQEQPGHPEQLLQWRREK